MTTLARRAAWLLALVLVLAGCGGAPAAAERQATTAAFPLTVHGYLGDATVPAAPTRVVALANGDADAAIALGITPVAMPRNSRSADGRYPWQQVDPAAVTLLDTATGIPFEQIAALQPDLILATNARDVSEAYPRLAAIAPTVTRPTPEFDQSWQEVTAMVGQALGRTEQAATVTAQVQDRIAAVQTAHPGLAGKEFSVAWVAGPGNTLVISSPQDQTVRFLGELTLRLAPALDGTGTLANEEWGRLDADLMLVAYSSPQLQGDTEADPLFARIPAVTDGRYRPVSLDLMTQLRSPTPAGIPWLLDQLDPALTEAAAR